MRLSFADEIKRFPFVRLTIPLIVGIILANAISIPLWIPITFLGISLVVFAVLKNVQKFGYEHISGISINVMLVCLGILLIVFNQQKGEQQQLANKQGYILGEIADDPKIKENNVQLELNIFAIKQKDTWFETNGRTILYLEKDSAAQNLQVGTKIIFTPELSEVENKGNPEEFDYKQYLAYNMIFSSDFLSSDDWQVVDDKASSFRAILSRARMKLVGLLQEFGLSADEVAVMSAMTMGYSDILSDEIRHAYSSSGAMHILAVSGLHVGIIYGIIVFLLSFIRNPKLEWLKVSATILLIWLYAIFTGLSPSVMRASLMFSLMSLGKLHNNSSGSLNGVFASMFILLVANPYNLMNIGFQLSYLAVIGIIVLQPKLYSIFTVKNKFLDWLWSLTTVSVAAQLATAPICLYYFHQFSNYFLLTNYVMIPISTIAIWCCVIFFAVSWIPYISTAVAWCLSWIAKAMNFSCLTIESLPFSTTENIYASPSQMLLLYLIIIMLVSFLFFTKEYKHLLIGTIFCLVYAGIDFWQNIESQQQKSLIVYNINKATAINIIDGRDNILFANLDSVQPEKIQFTAKNNWLKKGLNEEKYINLSSNKNNILTTISTINNRKVFFKRKFIAYENTSLYVLDDEFMPIEDSILPVKIDYLVIANSPQISLEDAARYFDFKKIIIASSNSNVRIDNWLAENQIKQFPLHNVKSDGAFIVER